MEKIGCKKPARYIHTITQHTPLFPGWQYELLLQCNERRHGGAAATVIPVSRPELLARARAGERVMADALLHAGAGWDALAQPAAALGGAVVPGLLRVLQCAARRGGGKWAAPLAVNGLVLVARPYEHARDREPLADLCRDNCELTACAQGYAFIGGCHLWPRSDVVARINALDAADVAGTQSCSMLAAAGVPWLETSEPARILADQWVQCERLDALEGAVAACRACWSGPQGRDINGNKEGLSWPSRTCDAPIELATAERSEQSQLSCLLALPWLPMFFEAWPLRGRLVAEALADRRAWVLSSHSGHQTSEGPETKSCGVLLMQRTPARLVVGVLASSSDVVAAALVFASRREHRFRVVFDLRDADWLDPQMGLPAKTLGGSLRQDLAELFAGEVEGTDRKVLIYGRSLDQDNESPKQ